MARIPKQRKNRTRSKLIAIMLFSIVFTVALLGALLFLPAGNLYWRNGWMLIASLIFYLLLVFIYFIIRDPATLSKRSRLSTQKGDALVLALMGLIFLALLLLPACNYRFGWSSLPLFVSWIGFAGLIIAYLLMFWVMRENSFASKGLMIHADQRVINTGPYAMVRHPMYSAAIIMSFCIPITLGSLISIIPAVFIPFILVRRIRQEEAMLQQELAGYKEYQQAVKYRLIPKVW